MLLFLLCLVPSQVNAQAVPTGIAVGGDNLTRLVWNNPDGSTSFWKIAADGSVASQNSYGPYPGWLAQGFAAGLDSAPRILWNHTADGQISLWRMDPSGASFTSANYGPYPGWSAASLGVGGNNAPRILWNHAPDNQMSLWNVAPDTTFTQGNYGPYTGYTAFRVAAGPNSVPRTLWNKSDGSISLWTNTGDTANYAHSEYGPYPGWTDVALAVDSTNAARIVWSHPSDSTISLWKVAADGTPAFQNFTNPAGYSPVALAAGTGGDVRLLWSNGQGAAQVWTIQSSGAYTSKTYPGPSALSFSPASITNGGTSTGTVTLSSPAPTNGAVVSLVSFSGAVTVPASVTVAAGQTSATFTVTGQTITNTATVTIGAIYNGADRYAGITVTKPDPVLTSISLSPTSAGLSLNGTQQFTAVGKDQNGTALSPQPTWTWSVVSGGVGAISPTGLYSAGATAGKATVKVVSGTMNNTADVTVTAVTSSVPYLSNLTLSQTAITSGGSVTGTVTLSGPAPVGGVTVNLHSNNSSVTTPANIVVLEGATTKSDLPPLYVPRAM